MRLLFWFTQFLDECGQPKKHHGIEHFELNLSTHTKYHFDIEERTLIKEPFESALPKKFWGEAPLYNINAIVGNNGVGKSTIIQTMMDTLQELYDRNVTSSNETIILIAEDDSNPIIIHLTGCGKPKNIKSSYTKRSLTPGKVTNELTELHIIDKTKIIYITNTLSQIDDERYKRTDNQPHVRANFIFDGSLCGTIRHNVEDDCYQNSQLDILNTFFINEYYKQVKFVCDNMQYSYLSILRNNKLPVPVPKKLFITMRINDDDALTGLFANALKQSQLQDSLDIIIYSLCALCVRTFAKNIHSNNLEAIPETSIPNTISFESFKTLFDEVANSDENQYLLTDKIDDIKTRCLNFVYYLCIFKHKMVFDITEEDSAALKNRFSDTTMAVLINDDTTEWLMKFMQFYRLTCVPYYYLDFSWGLSSGENNLLRLFSSLFYNFDHSGSKLYNWYGGERRTDCNSVILFLDEADLTYHPEWQRQFIQILTAFLPLEFGNCEIDDLQVVLTTHSPLLLGDMPSTNVTYLENGGCLDRQKEQINTFGQNIHTILKDSFFLNNGTIGAFAVSKINETAKRLRNPDNLTVEDLVECKAIIDLVSPGIIKGKLMTLYEAAEAQNAKKIKDKAQGYAMQLNTEELKNLIDSLNSEIERRQG